MCDNMPNNNNIVEMNDDILINFEIDKKKSIPIISNFFTTT